MKQFGSLLSNEQYPSVSAKDTLTFQIKTKTILKNLDLTKYK
jgi:hypothetical protein